MDIVLQPDVQKYIEEKVKCGAYASPQDAVNALLRRARSMEELSPDDADELREEIDLGLAEADRGHFVQFTAEDVVAKRHAADVM